MTDRKFSMDDYIDVAARIAEFREKYPDGSLQQLSLDFREVNGGWWVIYTAAAYRSPEDPRPGHGTAWEPVPGKTAFTRDSELQNAETAAWGRAIVAALAADTRRGIASAQEVQARDYSDAPATDERSSNLASVRRRLVAMSKTVNPSLKTEEDAVKFIGVSLTERGLSKDSVADLVKLANEWEGRK